MRNPKAVLLNSSFKAGIAVILISTGALILSTYTNPHPESTSSEVLGIGSGTVYYVDAVSGSNSNTGLSPQMAWQSIAKVNSTNFVAGESVLFKRGQTFTSSTRMNISESGSSGAAITIGAYGEGARPVIAVSDYSNSFSGAIVVSGSWITIQDLEITGTDPAALNEYGIHALGQNILITRMAIHNVGQGVGAGGRYIEISNSEIGDLLMVVEAPGDTTGYGAIGVMIEGGNDVNIHGNYFYRNKATGAYGSDGAVLEIYGNSNHITFAYNRVHDALQFVEAGSGNHNDLISNVFIHHNIVTQFDYGIFFHTDPNASNFSVNIDQIYVDNNTFVNTSMVGGGGGFLLGFASPPAAGKTFMRNNIVIQPLTTRFLLYIGGTERRGNLYNTAPLNGYNFSIHSTEKTNVNPRFVDAASGNFHLQSNSPAIDAGVGTGFFYDYDGNLISGTPDAGAYEYQGVSPTPPTPPVTPPPVTPPTPPVMPPTPPVTPPPATPPQNPPPQTPPASPPATPPVVPPAQPPQNPPASPPPTPPLVPPAEQSTGGNPQPQVGNEESFVQYQQNQEPAGGAAEENAEPIIVADLPPRVTIPEDGSGMIEAGDAEVLGASVVNQPVIPIEFPGILLIIPAAGLLFAAFLYELYSHYLAEIYVDKSKSTFLKRVLSPRK